jgi:N-acetylmuramoyl-L-alanine amidase
MNAPNLTVNIPKNMRPINSIFIHCSATPDGRDVTVEQIRKMHLKNGWNDIGYHFVIYRDGSVLPGRPISQIGAHAKGYNTGSIGICYIGGMNKENTKAADTRTPAQQESLIWLVKELIRTFGTLKIYGHNQVSAKSCPCFDVPSWVDETHLLEPESTTESDESETEPVLTQEDVNKWFDKWYKNIFKWSRNGANDAPIEERTLRELDRPIEHPLENNVEDLDAPEEPGWLDEF